MNNSQSPQWFSDVPATTPAPSKPPISRRTLVLMSIIVVMAIVAIALAQFSTSHGRTACLTTSDYKDLTGNTISSDGFSPATNFYSDTVTFKQNSVAYGAHTDTQVGGEALLKQIGTFYRQHDTTSIVVTISGSYYLKTAADLTKKRIDTVKASLINLDISGNDIATSVPTYVSPEDSMPSDPSTIHIALASRKSCITSTQEDQ